MAGPNTQPIYSKVADIQWAVNMTAANNNIDITTGTSYLLYTADATNGGFLREIRIKANPSQNTAATVARVWINNGSTTGTDTNSTLFTEIGIPATTTSATNAQPDFIVPMNIPIPPGYKIYLTFGTAPGGTGEFMATAIAGKY
jgi:hypothetical protein